MSEIENRVIPILAAPVFEGTPKIFSAEDIATILIYGVLKYFVSEYHHTHQTGRSFHTPSERAHFRRTFEIPSGTHAWIAKTGLTHGVYKGAYFKDAFEHPNRLEFYVFTLSLGRFVIQVLNLRWCKKSRRRYVRTPRLKQMSVWASTSIPICPNTSSPVCWPPPLELPSETLDAYVDRWRAFRHE
jgi:hypothetical protein